MEVWKDQEGALIGRDEVDIFGDTGKSTLSGLL